MNKNETLVNIVKKTNDGIWAIIRNEITGKTMKVFVPRPCMKLEGK